MHPVVELPVVHAHQYPSDGAAGSGFGPLALPIARLRPVNIAQGLENLKLEQDAIVLYDRLAGLEKDPRRAPRSARSARTSAGTRKSGPPGCATRAPTCPRPSGHAPRVRIIILAARVLGTRAVSDLVRSLEGDEDDMYEAQGRPGRRAIMADEREHAEIWQRLDAGGHAAEPPSRSGAERPPRTSDGPRSGTVETPGASQLRARPITRREGWHRAARSGTLRAAIFGISDGLVIATSPW